VFGRLAAEDDADANLVTPNHTLLQPTHGLLACLLRGWRRVSISVPREGFELYVERPVGKEPAQKLRALFVLPQRQPGLELPFGPLRLRGRALYFCRSDSTVVIDGSTVSVLAGCDQ